MRLHRVRHHPIAFTFLLLGVLGVVVVIWWFFLKPPQQSPSTASKNTDSAQPPAPDQKQLACIAKLPIEMVIGQKIMVAAYKDQIADQKTVLWARQVNGILVMDAVPASAIKSAASGFRITPSIAVDQEGGTVQRYTEEGTMAGASDMVKQSPQAAYQIYKADSTFLAAIGITTNFAPVVDVENKSPSPLPGRIFSNDPSVVTAYAKQAILAAQTSGITPVIKHFPGLGSADANTDFSVATTDSLESLKTRDVVPYQKLSPLQPDVMVNNAITPGLTNGQPAVWSKAAIDLLRSYGYSQAVVYSDSLTAQAIPGSLEDAAIKAWQAGVDVALIVQTKSQTAGLDGVIGSIVERAKEASAENELSRDQLNQSMSRILARKQVDACSLTP